MSRNFPASGEDQPLADSWSETDIVKKGCLHIKESVSLSFVKMKFKSWQARFLVLRDSWSHAEGVGETVLEIMPAAPNVEQSLPPTLHISSKLPVKTSFSASSSSSSSSKEISSLGIFNASLKDKCVDLKNVKYVDVHRTSRTFPHAFIVHRDDKPPLIIGAKSDLEMREWLMAIKLLADKACKNSQSLPRVRSLLATHQSTSGSNFRCFVVDVISSELETSPRLVSKLNGQFLFCVNPNGLMKIVSRQNNSNTRCKSYPESLRDDTDEDSGGSNGSEGARKEICHWNVEDVRKLKSENIPGKMECLVTLETSSRCREYRGIFKFHSMQGVELIQYIRSVASSVQEMSVLSKSADDDQKDRGERNRLKSEASEDVGSQLNTQDKCPHIPKPPPRPLFTISNP